MKNKVDLHFMSPLLFSKSSFTFLIRFGHIVNIKLRLSQHKLASKFCKLSTNYA